MKKAGEFIKKHKIVCIILVVLVIGGIAFGVYKSKSTTSDVDLSASLEEARTVTLAKGSLKSTVGVSGTVVSAVESEVTTEITDAKVTAIKVKVGDKVSKGDVIATLDTTQIDKDIAVKEKAISDANSKRSSAIESAQNALSKAQESYNKTVTRQNELVQAASNTLSTAQSALSKLKYAASTIERKIQEKQDQVDQKEEAYLEASEDFYSVTSEDPDYEEKKEAWENSKTDLANAQDELDTAKKVYQYDEYTNDVAKISEAQTAYDSAVSAREDAIDSAQSSVDSAQQTLTDAQSETSEDTSELDKLKAQKEACTLKAETSGEITQLNVKLGSIPSKGAIAVIQSTDQLILEVSIPEASINKVKKGLTVTVTADSIDEPVTGKLTMISSTAGASSTASTDDSSSSGSTSSGSGYKAQITLEKAGGLHIGSTAKGSILLEEKDNVFIVPIEAVGTDEGLSYIRVLQKDGSYKKISVKPGTQNETEVEITGDDLKEGMEVLSDVNYESLVDEATQESQADDDLLSDTEG